jgi:hypothetical protein
MQLLVKPHDRRTTDSARLICGHELVSIGTIDERWALLDKRGRGLKRRVGSGDPCRAIRQRRGRRRADKQADNDQ